MQSCTGDLQQQDFHHQSNLAIRSIFSSCWEAWKFCMMVLGKSDSAWFVWGKYLLWLMSVGSHKYHSRVPWSPGWTGLHFLALFIFFSLEYRGEWLFYITVYRIFFFSIFKRYQKSFEEGNTTNICMPLNRKELNSIGGTEFACRDRSAGQNICLKMHIHMHMVYAVQIINLFICLCSCIFDDLAFERSV